MHARGGVGCEKCHGGDPSARDADAAHRGVRAATEPESLVNPTRLPDTCGTCHRQELDAFKGTVHARELAAHGKGATCFTCHGAMATGLPTSRELSERCAVCHDRPVHAQNALAMVAMTKTKLYRARRAMDQAQRANPAWYDDAIRRFHGLERDYHDIQLKWHTFDTAAVIQETRDLLKLTDSITNEAEVMARRGAK